MPRCERCGLWVYLVQNADGERFWITAKGKRKCAPARLL